MNTRLHNYLAQILAVWLTLFVLMALVTFHCTGWQFYWPGNEPQAPVTVSTPKPAPTPTPAPEPAPAPKPVELPLLGQGRKAGQGTLGQPRLEWHEDKREVLVILPYTGQLGEYTSFVFDKVAALCFDFHGRWQHQEGRFQTAGSLRKAGCPVQLMQTGQHGSLVRLSLVGKYRARAIVRHSPSELHIHLDLGAGQGGSQAPAAPAGAPAGTRQGR